MNRNDRHIDLVGPVILIGVGVILLLNNLGVLSWGVGDILRLWPVLLVAAGLELLIGRRSLLGSIIAAVAVLAVILGIVWASTGWSAGVAGSPEKAAVELDGATAARVRLVPVIGQLNVSALDDSANLLESSISAARKVTLKQDYAGGETAEVTLEMSGPAGGWTTGPGGGVRWEVAINPGIELDLETDIAVGEVTLDLGELQPDDVKFDMGVGLLTLKLPAAGRMSYAIEGGVGQVVIEVPDGLEMQVTADVGLVTRSFPSEYRRSGNVFTSQGYADAESRATIDISLGVGSVTLREAGGD